MACKVLLVQKGLGVEGENLPPVVELWDPVVLLPCPPVVVELTGPVVVLNPPVVVFP
jgi:hypothetical protein